MMRGTASWLPAVLAVGVTAACASDGDRRQSLPPGSEGGSDHGQAGVAGSIDNPGSGGGGGAGTTATEAHALTVRVEDEEGLELELVTLSCAGDCAEVIAVARGGNPPYRFAWEDESSDPERTVCLDASTTLAVSVTDTSIDSEEFSYAAKTVQKELTATVLDCTDAGAPVDPPEGPCRPTDESEPPVVLGEIMPSIASNEPSYFADGAELPAGAYGLDYVDGCLRYDALYGWAVNAADTSAYLMIFASSDGTPPPGPIIDSLFGAATFEECVSSQGRGTAYFEHHGGRIGMYNNDATPADNTPGPDGRNPKFRLTRFICGDPELF